MGREVSRGLPLPSLCASVSLHHQPSSSQPPHPTHDPAVPIEGLLRAGHPQPHPHPTETPTTTGPLLTRDESYGGTDAPWTGTGTGTASAPAPAALLPSAAIPGGGSAARSRIHLSPAFTSQKYCSAEPAPSGTAAPASPRRRSHRTRALHGSDPPRGNGDRTVREGTRRGCPPSHGRGAGALGSHRGCGSRMSSPHAGPLGASLDPSGAQRGPGTTQHRAPTPCPHCVRPDATCAPGTHLLDGAATAVPGRVPIPIHPSPSCWREGKERRG